MGIFTKTKKKFRTKDVRVATTRITSSYSDGSGLDMNIQSMFECFCSGKK